MTIFINYAFILSFLCNFSPIKKEVHTKNLTETKRYLYVAVPGIRNYLEYGGMGLLVFDMDKNFKFVKRIPTHGLTPDGKPDNVKGICASLATQCIYITTIHSLQCIDIKTDKLVWERSFYEGFDRLEISPDGLTLYVPSFEKDNWNILEAKTGNYLGQVIPKSGAHNTIYGINGKEVYLEGLRSPYLTVVNPKNITETRQVGPFSASIRPFTVNGKQTLIYANVNDLLGFEIGDLKTGKKLQTITIQGFEKGPVKRHGCPSHGIGLTPNEKEIWVSDGFNQRVHVFDNTKMPPVQHENIQLRDQPGWITFSLDGKYAIPSTGEIIDTKTKKIIATLTDETGMAVSSEKLVELHIAGKTIVKKGSQFGIGRVF